MEDILSLVIWLIVVFGPALVSIFKKKDKKQKQGTKTSSSTARSSTGQAKPKQQEQASAQDIEAWLQALSEPKPSPAAPPKPTPAAKPKAVEPVIHDVEVVEEKPALRATPTLSSRPQPSAEKPRSAHDEVMAPKTASQTLNQSSRVVDAHPGKLDQRTSLRSSLSTPSQDTAQRSGILKPKKKKVSFAKRNLLGKGNAKRAIILNEIFSPPIALRNQQSH